MPHVLIIEDELRLLRSVARILDEAGYTTSSAQTLAAANQLFGSGIDLVVLDLMLPDGSGLVWLAKRRMEGCRTPVLVLTARDAVSDRVQGLDSGADDYLVKPFSLDELLARIRAMLRRDANPSSHLLSVGPLTVNLLTRVVTRDGVPLELQNRQLELLLLLMRNANEIVSREMISREVWKEPTATWTNVIEVHVTQLRKRLEAPGRPPILHTVRSRGYVLGDPP